MRVVTRHSRARRVATDFRNGICGGADEWPDELPQDFPAAIESRGAERTYGMLVELGKDPDPDAVDTILGTGEATCTQCNHCGSKNVAVMKIERLHDPFPTLCGGRRSLHLCRQCLQKAIETIDSAAG